MIRQIKAIKIKNEKNEWRVSVEHSQISINLYSSPASGIQLPV